MGAPVSAKNAMTRIGLNVFEGTRWRVKDTSKKIDVSNFEGNGYSDAISSISDAEFEVDGFWNSANNPYGAPTSINAGFAMLNLKLYLTGLAGLFWHFPVWLCEEIEMDGEVRDGMKSHFRGCNKGIYYRPGGIG